MSKNRVNTFSTNVLSELRSTDGSFQPETERQKANVRLKALAKHGNTVTIKVQGKNLALQFSFGGKRSPKGIGLKFTVEGVSKAEKIAEKVIKALEVGAYSDSWLHIEVLAKSNKVKALESSIATEVSCHEIITKYKQHFFRQRVNNRTPNSLWNQHLGIHAEPILLNTVSQLNKHILEEIINKTANNSQSRQRLLNGLTNLLDYWEIKDYERLINRYKDENKILKKIKYVPNELEIEYKYHNLFVPKRFCKRDLTESYEKAQFLYGLLAVYGLRVHEAWFIANWDNSVTLKNGDWVCTLASPSKSSDVYEEWVDKELFIPAILDPLNDFKLLCIKTGTKTGFRTAMPLSPIGKDWLKEFDLIKPLNLPNWSNALGRDGNDSYNCTKQTDATFKRLNIGFTPHALRHAYNHRGHSQNLNLTALSNSLGHSIKQNTSTYLRNMAQSTKVEILKKTMEDALDAQSSLDKALARIEELEAENSALKLENQKLSLQKTWNCS